MHEEGASTHLQVDSNPSKFQIKLEIEETLESLSRSFLKYFPNLVTSENEWLFNRLMELEAANPEHEEEEIIIDIRNDLVFKRISSETEISDFWIS